VSATINARPVNLPEHMQDSGEWREWPRKVDAHLTYGVRERQVSAHVRAGKLKAYICPDQIVRLDPDACAELYGPPGAVQGRDRDLPAAERERKRTRVEALDVVDPVAAMYRESTKMMREMFTEAISVLRIMPDSTRVLLASYEKTIEVQATRIATLEAHVDEAIVLRSELADAHQERELSAKKHEASEKRRNETMSLLKEQVPALVRLYVEGESLSSFAKRAPRDVIEAMIESGTLSESDTDLLRRHVPPKPKTAEPTPPAEVVDAARPAQTQANGMQS
jgi:regulator of replication initiation timing